jgi:hypothetical protein
MNRPWDSIEKVERAFSAYNRDQKLTPGGKQLPARAFRDHCSRSLKDIAPEERAAIDRWLSARLRG